MKAVIVQKQFNGQSVGTIIGIADQLPVNHLSSDGFIVGVDIPENIDHRFLKAEYVLVPEKWTKQGEADLSSRPLTEVNQPIITNDESWTKLNAQAALPQRWTKDGFATQYDEPPMIILNGEEIADESWDYHEPSEALPERWTKGESTLYFQPTLSEDNYVEVPDNSWTYHPAVYNWNISEDEEAIEAAEQDKTIEKYVKRIQYADIIIANIARRNESKTLTVPQIIEMNQVYSQVMQLLKSGSYASARSIILAATPSAGITQQDITYVVGLIETHLAGEA